MDNDKVEPVRRMLNTKSGNAFLFEVVVVAQPWHDTVHTTISIWQEGRRFLMVSLNPPPRLRLVHTLPRANANLTQLMQPSSATRMPPLILKWLPVSVARSQFVTWLTRAGAR